MSLVPATSPTRWLAIALAGLTLASCFGGRRGARDGVGRGAQSEDALATLPSREDLLALRAPSLASAPPDLAILQPIGALHAARLAAARGEMITPLDGADTDVDLAARACLWADALGDPSATLTHCLRVVELAPGDARAPAAIAIAARTADETADGHALLRQRAVSWMDACAVARGSCVDLVAVLSDFAIEHARIEGDRERVRHTALRVGRVVEGDAAGPYRGDDLVSFADPALAVPLVEDPPFTQNFRWEMEDGTFIPAARGESGIYVLRAAARGEGDAVLIAGGSRVLRVSIDGVVVLERRRDRPEPNKSRAGIHLSSGEHILEVMVHALGRGDDTAVAILDDRGQPVLRPVTKAPTRGAGVRTRRLAGAAEAMQLPKPAGASDAASRDLEALELGLWRHQLARARVGLTVRDERAAAEWLLARFGFAPEALLAGALTLAADDEIPKRQAWAFAEPLFERAAAAWPASPRARWALTANLRAQQPERGLELLRAHVAAFPRHAPGLRALVSDALEAGLLDEARDAAEMLLGVGRTPRNLETAIQAYESLGDVRQVATLGRERDAFVRSPTAETAARTAQRDGDLDRALDLLRKAAEAERFSSALASYVDALTPHDAGRALEVVDQALGAAPYDDALIRRRAALTLHVQGAEAARAWLRQVLRERPTDRSLQRLAEELDMPMRWHERARLGDATIAKRRAMQQEPFSGHAAVFLLDDVVRSLHIDGSSTALRHWIVELRTKDAIDRFGEVNVEDERVIILRVVKPDGRVLEPDEHAGVEDVSLPGLAPGDIVELLTQSIASSSPFPRSGYETRSLDLTSLPALSRSYVVDAPRELVERTGFAPVAFNGLPMPLAEETQDALGVARLRFTFALADVPAARPEPFEPAREETAKTAGFAYGVDASLWARMRGRGLHLAALGTPWLDASARRIAGSGTDEEKLERLFAFVARRIEPGQASDAAEVLATGQGQRTPLLLALARAAGLRVRPVAIHFTTQPPPELIDSDAWALLALAVQLEDREAIAVADRIVVLDALPLAASGARMLDVSLARIARADARIGPVPASAVTDDGVHVRVELRRAPGAGAAQDLVGDVRVEIPAAFADGIRRDVRKAAPDVAKSWVEQALQASFPGLAVAAVQFPQLDAAGAPLSFEAKVRIALAPLSDGTVRFEHLFASGSAAAFALGAGLPATLGVAERTRPLLLAADRESLEVRLVLGEEAAFLEVPETLERTAGPVTLTQRTEVTDGTLIWQRELAWDSARVPPSEWPTLRVALADLVARLDARTAFVLTTAVSASTDTTTDVGALQ